LFFSNALPWVKIESIIPSSLVTYFYPEEIKIQGGMFETSLNTKIKLAQIVGQMSWGHVGFSPQMSLFSYP
jgi:hypothetical protein